MSPPRDVLEAAIRRWLNDPDSAVVYAEQLDGRWAVRMTQEVRDATTVWFTVGERSIGVEAYVLGAPAVDPGEAYRQCLVRNARTWRIHYALDAEGAMVLRGRIAVRHVSSHELDLVLGEIYETVEVSFRSLARVAFDREKTS